jgi:hypothetical protein
MPTVFASVSVTILFFYLATMAMAYLHLVPVGFHMLWGCFTALLVIFLQCLVFGFFINSGKSIKKVVQDHGLNPVWIQKTKDYKNRCYPALMLAIVASVAAAVVGGGVSVGAIPVWVHQGLVWIALGLNLYSLFISYQVVVENVRAIHQINAEVGKAGEGIPTGPMVPEVGVAPEGTPARKPANPSSRLYFLGAAVWVPYLYMKFSLGSRTFPLWPFLAVSVGFILRGWWISRTQPRP